MKLIDEKGRLFGKVNIFDFIILLAIVLVVGAVGYKVVKSRLSNSAQAPVKHYIATVKCSAMPDSFDDALLKDARIYYDTEGFVNGEIIDVKEEPAVIEVTTADGKLVEAQSPSLKDVYVYIDIADKANEDSVKLGKYSVAVGGRMTVKTPFAMGADGSVIDLKEK